MNFFVAALLLAAPDEVPFEPSTDTFADAAACKARLLKIVAEERARPHVALQGPYDLVPGDVRAHWIDVSGSGHRITEQRCLDAKLAVRTWRHSMDERGAREVETIEDMAGKAEWLKKSPAEKQ